MGSSVLDRKAGVIPYTIQMTEADTIGHRVSVTITQNNMPQASPIMINNIYASNNPTTEYFKDMATWFFSTWAPHIS